MAGFLTLHSCRRNMIPQKSSERPDSLEKEGVGWGPFA